ncbi:MAG: hypothetical protein WD690_16320 [Vicinamibacterales bacterium]
MNRQSEIINLQFLLAAGAVASAAIAWIGFGGLPLGSPRFLAAAGLAAAGYGVALVLAPRTACTRWALLAVAILTIFMRVPPAMIPVGGGSDMLRYIWDARAQRAGVSPYVAVPANPQYAHLHTPQTRKMNNTNIPSPYPPGAQLFFRAVTSIHESTTALKIALVACDLMIAGILVFWLRSAGRNPLLAMAYAWNPIVVLEVAHSGHLDVAGALAVTIAAFALARGRQWLSVGALAAGIAIKFLPIVLLPLYWKRVRIAHAAFGAAILGGLYLLFLDPRGDTVPLGSVTNMVRTFRFNGPVFKAIEFVSTPWLAAGVGVTAGLACAILMRQRLAAGDPAAWAWPMAAALVCSPVIYPWYLLWLTPFFISALTAPLMLWTILIPTVYIVWYGMASGAPWAVPIWLGLLEFGSLVGATIWMIRRRRDRLQLAYAVAANQKIGGDDRQQHAVDDEHGGR